MSSNVTALGGAAIGPGVSNTRRKKPPEAHGGRAETNASHHSAEGSLKLLSCRIDYWQLAYRGQLDAPVRRILEARSEDAQALGTSVSVEIGTHAFVLAAPVGEGRWNMRNAQFRIAINLGTHLDGWTLEITADAKLLATRATSEVLREADDIAHALFKVFDQRLRRADVSADFSGFDLNAIDRGQWHHRSRANVKEFYAEHTKGYSCTGVQVGSGNVVARIYDKTRELRDKPDEEKRSIEHAQWAQAGWDGHSSVTRVEFQLRGDALSELDGGVREPTRFLARVDAIWAYCTRWLRLVRLDSPRRARCPNDARWDAVQATTFDVAAAPSMRVRTRGASPARLVFGTTCNYLAAREGLARIGRENVSAREWFAGKPKIMCEEFVRTIVTQTIAIAAESVAADLLTCMGHEDAAAYVLERYTAATVRHQPNPIKTMAHVAA